MNIISLPESLAEALHEMEKSQTMKEILGEKIFKNFLDVKWAEWGAYRTQISDWEFHACQYTTDLHTFSSWVFFFLVQIAASMIINIQEGVFSILSLDRFEVYFHMWGGGGSKMGISLPCVGFA